MSDANVERENGEEQKVVVRDRRKIDPVTGAVREPGAGDAGAAGAGDQLAPPVEVPDEAESLRARLAERTADLQRITAEYANYRKRVERDRVAVVDGATRAVLTVLLPLLDDIERAREHGDLTGAFKAVADQLEGMLEKLGLRPVGTAGDPFDPMLHEAVAHHTSPDVTLPTCTEVMRRGYRHGERLLRPALVAVADPEPAPPATAEPLAPSDLPGSGVPASGVPASGVPGNDASGAGVPGAGDIADALGGAGRPGQPSAGPEE